MHRNLHQKRKRLRRGAALTELAACLPIMCVVVFGAIELTDTVFLKQRLSSIAYETAGLYADGNTSAKTLGEELAKARKVVNSQFAVTYSDSTVLSGRRLITVTVSANASDNSLLRMGFMSTLANTITASTTVVEQ